MDLLAVLLDDNFTLGLFCTYFLPALGIKGPAQPQTQTLVRQCETNVLGSEV